MITVQVAPYSLTVEGHAGYAEVGKDIVCAAVSALIQNLITSLETLTQDHICWRIREGYMDLRWENLSEKGSLLVDSFFLGVCLLADSYGSYIQISGIGRDNKKINKAECRQPAADTVAKKYIEKTTK